MEMEACIYYDQLEEAHEYNEICERVQEERREAEQQERLRAEEAAAEEQAVEAEERRQAELREHLRATEAAAAAAEAEEAEEERRQAELEENWRAAEAAAAAAAAEAQYQRSLVEERQRMEAEVQARINQHRGTAPGEWERHGERHIGFHSSCFFVSPLIRGLLELRRACDPPVRVGIVRFTIVRFLREAGTSCVLHDPTTVSFFGCNTAP